MSDMTPQQVLIFPRGQLTSEDKDRLTTAGIVAVEADYPDTVQQISMAPPLRCETISGDAIVQAALQALAGQPCQSLGGSITPVGTACHEFVKSLAQALAKEQP